MAGGRDTVHVLHLGGVGEHGGSLSGAGEAVHLRATDAVVGGSCSREEAGAGSFRGEGEERCQSKSRTCFGGWRAALATCRHEAWKEIAARGGDRERAADDRDSGPGRDD